MGMWNLRGRTGRCAPWLAVLAVLGSIGQGLASIFYVAVTWNYGSHELEAGAWTPAMTAVVSAVAVLGLALTVLTLVSTFGRNKSVIFSSVAGIACAVAFMLLAQLGVSWVSEAPEHSGAAPFGGLILLFPTTAIYVSSSALFGGFAIALSIAATQIRASAAVAIPREPAPHVASTTSFTPLPVADGDEAI